MGSPQSAKAIPEGMAFSTLVVTSSGETSNFLMEDLERVLQLETLEINIL